MKTVKLFISAVAVVLTTVSLSGCESTSVSGSIHYSSHFGGYPTYYDPWHRNNNIIVVPPKPNRPGKPSIKPPTRPKPHNRPARKSKR